MDEVLRRIERMEKKQLQQKQRPCAVDKQETEEMNGTSGSSVFQPGSESVHDAPVKTESDPGPLERVGEKLLSIVKPVFMESAKTVVKCAFSPLPQTKPQISTTEELQEQPEAVSAEALDANDTFMKDDDKQSDPCSATSLVSPIKVVDLNKSCGKQKQSGSSLRSKRRRSQIAVATESSPRASVERRDSREDRWLKSQLRRIAQLEDQSAGSQKERDHTTLDCFTNGSDTSANSHIDDFASDQTKEVSHEVTALEACQSDIQVIDQEIRSRRRHRQSCTEQPSLEPLSSSSSQIPINGAKDRDSEADCTLIVYRTREKDPMAKFSRNRRAGLSLSTTASGELISAVPETNEIDAEMTPSYPMLPTANPSAHSAPRPTKKRWLSQVGRFSLISDIAVL